MFCLAFDSDNSTITNGPRHSGYVDHDCLSVPVLMFLHCVATAIIRADERSFKCSATQWQTPSPQDLDQGHRTNVSRQLWHEYGDPIYEEVIH